VKVNAVIYAGHRLLARTDGLGSARTRAVVWAEPRRPVAMAHPTLSGQNTTIFLGSP
jgi:hypothetical protein